jgi:hypothetical protein
VVKPRKKDDVVGGWMCLMPGDEWPWWKQDDLWQAAIFHSRAAARAFLQRGGFADAKIVRVHIMRVPPR